MVEVVVVCVVLVVGVVAGWWSSASWPAWRSTASWPAEVDVVGDGETIDGEVVVALAVVVVDEQLPDEAVV